LVNVYGKTSGFFQAYYFDVKPGDRENLCMAAEDQRHAGAWNMVACDGHVSDSRRPYLFDSRDDEVLRRWNRDNLPHRENLPAGMR
jgi:prepilin-type processing-associated H-X9-DG protein